MLYLRNPLKAFLLTFQTALRVILNCQGANLRCIAQGFVFVKRRYAPQLPHSMTTKLAARGHLQLKDYVLMRDNI
jgi:hypothetical protein